jgi:hypothetical protein
MPPRAALPGGQSSIGQPAGGSPTVYTVPRPTGCELEKRAVTSETGSGAGCGADASCAESGAAAARTSRAAEIRIETLTTWWRHGVASSRALVPASILRRSGTLHKVG